MLLVVVRTTTTSYYSCACVGSAYVRTTAALALLAVIGRGRAGIGNHAPAETLTLLKQRMRQDTEKRTRSQTRGLLVQEETASSGRCAISNDSSP